MIYSFRQLQNQLRIEDLVRHPGSDYSCPCGVLMENEDTPVIITKVNKRTFSIETCSHYYEEEGYLDLITLRTLEELNTI